MVRLTAWVSDEQKEWVEEHADKHGVEQAAVVRQLIDAARYGESPLDSPTESFNDSVSDSVSESQIESLVEQIEELAERVGDLENDREQSQADEDRSATSSRTRDPYPSDPQDTPPEPPSGDVEEILADWPPRSEHNREERREAAVAALEWLRDEAGVAGRPDFVDALFEGYVISGQSEDTWWRKTIRPALMEADEAGIVEFHEGRWDYEWKGE